MYTSTFYLITIESDELVLVKYKKNYKKPSQYNNVHKIPIHSNNLNIFLYIIYFTAVIEDLNILYFIKLYKKRVWLVLDFKSTSNVFHIRNL